MVRRLVQGPQWQCDLPGCDPPGLAVQYKKWAETKAIRSLVYSGDVDPGVKYMGSEEWTSGLKLKERQTWRPWTLDNGTRMGGYVTRYEGT